MVRFVRCVRVIRRILFAVRTFVMCPRALLFIITPLLLLLLAFPISLPLRRPPPSIDGGDDGRGDHVYPPTHEASTILSAAARDGTEGDVGGAESPPKSDPQSSTRIQVAADTLSTSACEELPCRSRMRESDRESYEWCVQTSLRRLRERGISAVSSRDNLVRGRCRLVEAGSPNRLPVFLASAPGSGNTWLRGLLERVTELCTGSVYCDEELRALHFEAEGIRSDSVLVVKTHIPTPTWSSKGRKNEKNVTLFGSGILLVRNPLKSLVAHRKWILGERTNLSSHTADFEIAQDSEWTEFVYANMKQWVAMFRYVLSSSPDHPVLVVSYEELVRSTAEQLRRVLAFLGLGYDVNKLDRLLPADSAAFRRRQSSSNVRALPFTAWQLDTVKKHVRLAVQLLEHHPHVQKIVRHYYTNEWI